MSRTAFDPAQHGFAFVNSWDLDESERQALYDAFDQFLKWSLVVGTTLFGLPGAILVPIGILALRNKLEAGLAPGYGLCGGMAFAALDYFLTGEQVPRGKDYGDRPAAGTPLRRYLWQRQIRSLVSDLDRFLAWLVMLKHVPTAWPFGGGPARLAALTRKEWAKLKARIDQGTPVPLGLVRDTEYVFDNHQVLATGYDEEHTSSGTIYLYDPNCPDTESEICVAWDGDGMRLAESCAGVSPLRGFFCEIYTPSTPPCP
jgi:hypothetical protein